MKSKISPLLKKRREKETSLEECTLVWKLSGAPSWILELGWHSNPVPGVWCEADLFPLGKSLQIKAWRMCQALVFPRGGNYGMELSQACPAFLKLTSHTDGFTPWGEVSKWSYANWALFIRQMYQEWAWNILHSMISKNFGSFSFIMLLFWIM